MEDGQYRHKSKKKRCRRLVLCALVLLVIVVIAVVLGVTLSRTTESFQQVFMNRCDNFAKGEYDCTKIWSAFEQAYVGKNSCAVSPEAYDPLMAAAPFIPACNRMLFWSKTKDVVHDFTEKRSCYGTLEDTLLGSVLDGLTWCGKEGSSETVTSDCPAWSRDDCVPNSVRSFWNKASASFAHVACGDVSVMLNGSIETPFNSTSIFASIEVKQFRPDVMKRLKVVLVTQEKEVTNCTNKSLKDLQKELAQGIAYSCEEVPESRIEECASKPDIPCGGCW